MSKFIIQGGKPLTGEIKVSGAKNAALKAVAASLLSDEEIIINNVPQVEDVKRMLEILERLGGKVENLNNHRYKISTKNINNIELDRELVPKLRASIVFIGPLLAKVGEVKMPHPGGCAIGKRPIDLFIKGFKTLGVEVEERSEIYYHFKGKPKGGKFIFPIVSVTLTETLMMAATLAEGKTTLINTACDPEISVLAEYLNSGGAKIKGAGTPFIVIEGVEKLSAGEFNIIPDRIETGAFAALAGATQSKILIKDCHPQYIEVELLTLEKIGVRFERGRDYLDIFPSKKLKAVNITTHEYPGFATDLQPPFTVLLTQAEGNSLIHETIFEGRLFYTDILNRMGADITLCDPHRVIVRGPTKLFGRQVESPDIRAGIALVIAGLVASGTTEIDSIYQIDRGYEKIEQRLQALGAGIKRVD